MTFSCPYPRLLLPPFLSPIMEEDDVTQQQTTNGVSSKEVKITTAIVEIPKLDLTSNPQNEDDVLSNQNQSAPRDQGTDRKQLIESHSGRKQDFVEVLKQKYINNDIQDLPRQLGGPVKYGRLHRSRSSHVNLGSTDIRSQMNKIRLKLGKSPNLENGGKNGVEESKSDHRCTKLKDARTKLKSLEDFLYGDRSFDDYDPELAALFDDYIEDCDQSKRSRSLNVADPVTKETDDVDKMLQEKLDRIEMESDTKKAFWTGFIEGMYHSSANQKLDSDKLDQTIQGHGVSKPSTKDPCMDKLSHITMIRSNQDITHKFLKEWEQEYKLESEKAQEKNSHHLTCKACKAENKAHTDDTNDVIIMDKKVSDDMSTNKRDAEKPHKSRDPLPIGMTELEISVPRTPNQKVKVKPETKAEKHLAKLKTKIKLMPIVNDLFRMKKLKFDVGDTQALRKAMSADCLPTLKHEPLPTPCTPSFSSQVGTDLECKLKEKRFMNVSHSSDEINIITLAKQRLEHASMSSLIFDTHSTAKSSKLQTERDHPRQVREVKETKRKETSLAEQVFNLGDFDGWVTKSKHSYDQDNLHLSSSDILHPVEVLEPLERMYSPSWTPSRSTPLLTPITSKNIMKVRASSQGPTPTPVGSPTCGTPISAILADLEDPKPRNCEYATKAFKPNSRFSGDYNRAADLVKLRLTKSCDNFPRASGVSANFKDKAFANVPLACCLTYNIENNLKSSIKVTASINLSEKLAEQLKTIGKDKASTTSEYKSYTTSAPTIKDIHNAQSKPNEQKEMSESKANRVSKTASATKGNHEIRETSDSMKANDLKETDLLPAISVLKVSSVEDNKETKDDANRVSFMLPEIIKARTPTNLSEIQSAIEQLSLANKKSFSDDAQTIPSSQLKPAEPIGLPPISVTSLLNNKNTTPLMKAPEESNLEMEDDFDNWIGRSLAVRAESCTSPYNFDKSDPNKLLLKARSVPHLHTVCTSCGGISESTGNTSGHERDNKRFSKTDRSPRSLDKALQVHHKCCSPCNDEKWKLEKANSDHVVGLPKLKGARLFSNHQSKNSKKNQTEQDDGVIHTKRKSKPRSEEMTFRFMDKDIRLRFESDFSTDDNDTYPNIKRTASKANKWLDNMALPACRERMACPIARETGIYKQKKNKSKKSEPQECAPPSTPTHSPYLEYCKRKSSLRYTKHSRLQDEYYEFISDTCLLGATTPNDARLQDSKHKFPVIPIKKSKENQHKKGKNTKHDKNKIRSSGQHSDTAGTDDLYISPGHLPLLKTETKSTVATPDCRTENKVGKIATPKIDEDGRDSMSVCTSIGTHGNVSRQSTRCN